MPFFLDTQETVQRFGSQVAEFHSLLDTDHVRHGSPDDLFEFARTLDNSNQFRLDLSTLVKSVVKRSNDELLLTDMMSIIATSVGGPSVAETHADITKPTNTLMEFLLGTGCWRQFGLPSRPVSSSAAQAPRPTTRTEAPAPVPISLPDSPAPKDSPPPKVSENLEDQPSLLDVSNELRQTLSRLESNTEQVKLHLDSIERRIGTIKPPLDDAPPPKTSSGLEPLLYRGFEESVDDKKVVPSLDEDEPIFGARPAASNRAVFAPPPEPHVFHAEDNDFSSPTFAYGSEKERSIISLGVLLVILVAILVGGVFYAYSAQGRTLLKAGLSRLQNISTPSASAPPLVSPAPTATPPLASLPPSTTSAESPASPSSITKPVAPEKAPDGTATPTTAASESATPTASQTAPALPGNPKFRYVSSNVMEGYLLSAPRPEYPPQARSAHIEGQVTMQATISRSGSIVTLHVTNGPSSLRSAAIDAVRSWRYRPYVVDGRPVPVATTVYVDFNLRPPPAIVH